MLQQGLWVIRVTDFSEKDLNDEKKSSHILDTIQNVSGIQYGDVKWWYESFLELNQQDINVPYITDWLADEGKKFIASLNTENQKANSNIIDLSSYNVCVIGNVTHKVTLLTFHILPALIEICKASFFTEGIHQGINIRGILYVPNNINSLEDKVLLEKITVFLACLNALQSNGQGGRYDELILLQNEQEFDIRTESYTSLSSSDITNLISQMLCNIYIGIKSRVFSRLKRIHGNNINIYSIGATALHYDFNKHIEDLSAELGNSILEKFKYSKNDAFFSENQSEIITKRTMENLAVAKVQQLLIGDCGNVHIDVQQFEPIQKLHPVKNFWNFNLLAKHFQNYLKYLPARLHEYTRLFMSKQYEKWKNTLNKNLQHYVAESKNKIKSETEKIFSNESNTVGLEQYISVIKKTKEKLTEEKNKIGDKGKQNEIYRIPKYLKPGYDNYSELNFLLDANGLITKLKSILEVQSPFIGTIARGILIGISLVFVIIPFIFNKPEGLIFKWLFAIILLIIPIISMWFLGIRRQLRAIRQKVYKYIGMHLRRTEYAVKEAINQTMHQYYSELIDYCVELEANAEKIYDIHYPINEQSLFPVHTFSQPLVDGSFGRNAILENNTLVSYTVKMNPTRFVKYSELIDSDYVQLIKNIFQNQSLLYLILYSPENISEIQSILKDEMQKCYNHASSTSLYNWLRQIQKNINLTGLYCFAAPAAVNHFGTNIPDILEIKCDNHINGIQYNQFNGLVSTQFEIVENKNNSILFFTRASAMSSIFDSVRPVWNNTNINDILKDTESLFTLLSFFSCLKMDKNFSLEYLDKQLIFNLEDSHKVLLSDMMRFFNNK
jgi:hypothetical protein